MSHYRIKTPISGFIRTDVDPSLARKPILEGIIRLRGTLANDLVNLGAVEATLEDVTVRIAGDDFEEPFPTPAFLSPDHDGNNSGGMIREDDEAALVAAIEALGGFVYFANSSLENLATRFTDDELAAEVARRLPGARIVTDDAPPVDLILADCPSADLLGELVKRAESGLQIDLPVQLTRAPAGIAPMVTEVLVAELAARAKSGETVILPPELLPAKAPAKSKVAAK